MAYGSLAELADLLRVNFGRQVSSGSFSAGSDASFRGISTDSRTLEPGSVFVALRGETFDGHAFVSQALDHGAVLAIGEQALAIGSSQYWQVPNALGAYQAIARWWRTKVGIPIIAITGSAGKTSTKEMAAVALSRFGSVLKSQANHNNDIGVAQTLLQLQPDHQFAVLEMAMRGPGEIARLAATAQPTHALITNIGTAHIGRLGSRQAIAQAKCELLGVGSLQSAILNGEDELLLTTAKEILQVPAVTFGLSQGQIRGEWDPQAQTIRVGDLTLPIPLPGRHHALNWISVVALVQQLGLDLTRLEDPMDLLDLSAALPGRHQVIQLPGDIQVWDETYNAAPEAMIAALQALCQTPGRHGAVLGPMRELGIHAADLYAQVGSAAAQLPLDYLLLLDPDGEMDPLLRQLQGSQFCQSCQTGDQLLQTLASWVRPGDRILFKAARAVGLERVMGQFIEQSIGDKERCEDSRSR